MNLNLKPHPLVAHWIPGFTACCIILISVFSWNYECLIKSFAPTTQGLALSVFLLSIVAFIIGQILDVFRNSFIEGYWDKKHEIKWDFFFWGDKEKIDNIDERYYTWYVFDVNMCTAIFIGSIVTLLLNFIKGLCLQNIWPLIIIMFVLFLLFYRDSRELRNDIKRNIDNWYKENEKRQIPS